MLSLFLGGLFGSLSHCTGMCGPFVMAQVSGTSKAGEGMFRRLRGAALLPYHAGRITTYSLLGLLAATLSGSLMGTPFERGVIFTFLMLSGVLFLANAIPALKAIFPMPDMGGIAGKMGAAIGKIAAPFMQSHSPVRRYALGMMLGLLPCGLVLAALMAVTATGDPLVAVAGMMFFGLGTVPALFVVGTGTRLALARWPNEVQLIASGMMAVNGVSLMVVAGSVVM